MTEAIWLGLLSIVSLLLVGLGGLLYNTILNSIAVIEDKLVVFERKQKRFTTALILLNQTAHPDAEQVIKILTPLIENGDICK